MKKLTVQEKYSRYWPAITKASSLLAIFLWILYMLVSDVLLEGYLRLAAFCFFALALLSFFKVKDGRIQINLQIGESGELELDYLVRGENIAHDSFAIGEFKSVEVHRMPNRTLYNDFATGDRTVRFRRRDSEGWLYLTEIHGRVIPLEQENADKVADFLSRHIIEYS